ncbi:hypothetical protein Asppvi_001525 [Aspergillus pseudoviridinutans]|uniref:Methyltransferase domain-containing protein n=1 Tax=Aspergillus pseudoviridinutans TaxID=1517512 RepID=A0A9P3B587_9EURO|nr:uncharacterized protein Asppvi_001525 [Aspergillus pseudoviridinutans]GIJ83008.1 hypothetical protein Asppvi_001525 [Aspergillus pseudoviridinutans]
MTGNSTARSGFLLANGRPYMLERTYSATARLNYQHYLFRECVKFNLHPSIPVPPNARIADVATGTAIWLYEVARDIPTATLDGLDISLDSGPPAEWLPKNATLRQLDIFDDVPPDLVGTYDIVHLRFFMLVVRESDPIPVIRKLLAMEQLRQFAYSDGRNNWTLDIQRHLRNEGFIRTGLFQYRDPPERAKANNEEYIMCLEEFANRLDQEGERQDAQEVYDLIGKINEESQRGAALIMDRLVSIGQRATPQSQL